jgi:pimeloyl-ACP methyl ester carboxylesterase
VSTLLHRSKIVKKFLKCLLVLLVIATIVITVFWFARPADLSFDELRASVPNLLIKGSKLVIIEKCGHVPQEEMSERTVDEIEKFIAESNKANYKQ